MKHQRTQTQDMTLTHVNSENHNVSCRINIFFSTYVGATMFFLYICFQGLEMLTIAFVFAVESEQQNMNKEINDTDIDNFSMEFINDNDNPNENFIDDGTIDYSNSTSYEVVEETTKVSHGMFVATRQVADTFFHKLTPSQTIKVQLNPIMENTKFIEKAKTLMIQNKQGYSLLRKIKANMMEYMKKPSKTIASAIVFMFALFWVLCVYLKEQVQDMKPKSKYVKKKYCYGANSMKKIIWNEKEKVWFVGIKSGKGFDVVLKKIGILLTISLAICTMWANHMI